MSDLHRAIQERADDFRPDRTPPFDALRDRKRRHDQQRAGGAVALSVVAVVGVALGSSVFGSSGGEGDSSGQIAATPPSATASPSQTAAAPTVAGTADYMDRLYACLNEKGYTFTEGPDGGWSGAISGSDVPYEEARRAFDAHRSECRRERGVSDQTPPNPAAGQPSR